MQRKRTWIVIALTLVVVFAFASLFWPTERASTLRERGAGERRILTDVPRVYRPEVAPFGVGVADVISRHRVIARFVMPGDVIPIEVQPSTRGEKYSVEAEGGALVPVSETAWRWHAPDSAGHYAIYVDERPSRSSIAINAFVMVPYDLDDEELRGYRIGQYRRELYRGDSAYVPPRGFIEVTRQNEDILVSPHFTLGQFLCKQESGYPKFLLLREQLILKLEMLLQEVNERGISTPTLHVMSAFRTPFYNRLIGNDTDYSRHLYGGAADVFVDANGDTYMDDVNSDGEVTREDAEFLAAIIEEQTREPWYEPFIGGLGIYSPAAHRGPFIHVDVRGAAVRW